MKKRFLTLAACALALCAACTDREPEVRNVIYLIGDGMGLAQVSQIGRASCRERV